MRKLVLILAVLISVVSAVAKTTYIPKYRTYIHIVDGSDTIVSFNIYRDLELKDKGDMFNIIVEHEDVTKEKVKAIKRAKRAAGWATFSAVMSGVSTAFSDNSLQYMVRSTNTQIATQIAEIYTENANAEQKLGINMWIENMKEEELLINDMERGLTWYIKPRQYLHFQLSNPDVLNFRISDIHNDHVRYVVITAGSVTYKKTIDWEDDAFWFAGSWKRLDENKPDVTHQYLRISKTDFTETVISSEAFNAYKKNTTKKE